MKKTRFGDKDGDRDRDRDSKFGDGEPRQELSDRYQRTSAGSMTTKISSSRKEERKK